MQINNISKKTKRKIIGSIVIAVSILTAFFVFRKIDIKEKNQEEHSSKIVAETNSEKILETTETTDLELSSIENQTENIEETQETFVEQINQGKHFLNLVLTQPIDTLERINFNGVCVPTLVDGIQSYYRQSEQVLKDVESYEARVVLDDPLTIDYIVTIRGETENYKETYRLEFNDNNLISFWQQI